MPNRLINEQSPYLLQHAHNPVDWYPWSDEAFEKAKQENKPVLVSIGYAACHWCHVMERESFEKSSVADYMNRHFVCIKVDREEHPDVDHMYMDAVQAISGSGGWPLNVFVTPERIPFYGGTYFPPRAAFNRPSWLELLQRMNDIWIGRQDEVTAQAEQMIAYLRQASRVSMPDSSLQWDMDTCRKMADSLLQQADKVKGGFGNAPKFPGTMAISFLLEHYHFTKYAPALKQALLSLDSMIAGGIYDQLGGGFARYSTDAEWLAPHFEKMLYDNALLVSALCDAYSLTKDERYRTIINQTIEFAERELKNEYGGYYSALDADSEGEEGKFYTWTWKEWVHALGGDDPVAAAYFGVVKEGNWEGTNILHIARTMEAIAKANDLPLSTVNERINSVKKKLLDVRNGRVRPLTDDKSLLSWNALMNISLAKAGTVLGEKRYLLRAVEHMEWMLKEFEHDNVLLHTWKNGVAKIAGNLDDYAYLMQALLQLASASGQPEWIIKANKIMSGVIDLFLHEDGGYFYYTSTLQQDIPVRKIDLYDGALPSANAVMAHNLLILGLCMERNDWMEQATGMLRHICANAVRYTYSFSYWSLLLQRYAATLMLVTCVAENADVEQGELKRYFMPQCYLLTSKKEIFDIPILENKFFADKVYIFVCTQQACLPPVHRAEDILPLIHQ